MARPLRFGEANKRNNKKVRKNNKGRDLRLESLETRALLSVSPAAPISDAAEAVYAAPAELSAPEVDLALFEQTTVNNNDAQAADASLQSLAGYEVGNSYIVVVDVANAADDTDATTTLNEAIKEANSLATSYDTITIGFAEGINTHTLNASLTAITSNIVIDGGNTYDAGTGEDIGDRDETSYVTIDGNSIWSGLNFTSGTSEIKDLNIQNCTATQGGAIYNNAATLTISGKVTLANNTATQYGGGIYNNYGTIANTGELTIDGRNSDTNEIINASYGGGLFNAYGKINNTGTLVVQNNRISEQNFQASGGGIYNQGEFTSSGDLKVTNNTIAEGGLYGMGAAVYNAGTFTVTGNLTVSDNSAEGDYGIGGGFFNENSITIDISDNKDAIVTISDNKAQYGGGFDINNGSVTITGSTPDSVKISGNEAEEGATIDNKGALTIINATVNGEIASSSSATTDIIDSIVENVEAETNLTLIGDSITIEGKTIYVGDSQVTLADDYEGELTVKKGADDKGVSVITLVEGVVTVSGPKAVTVKSGSVSVTGSAPVTINGTDDKDKFVADGNTVKVNNNTTVTFDEAFTGSVTLDAGAGADLILVNRDNTIVNAGAGNDFVVTGTATDADSLTWTGSVADAMKWIAAGSLSLSEVTGLKLDGGGDNDVLYANDKSNTASNFEITLGSTWSTVVVTAESDKADTDALITMNEAIAIANEWAGTSDVTIGFAVDSFTQSEALTQISSNVIIDGYNVYKDNGTDTGTDRGFYVTINGAGYDALNFASSSVSELDYVEVTGATTGLINKGSLTIGNASFSDNHGGYGANKDGGGIYNEGTITVTCNLEVSNNSAQHGGGIANYGGTFTNASGATMTVENNTSTRDGAGIYNEARFTNFGTLTLTGNQITSGSYKGGGIYNKGASLYDDTVGTFTNTGKLTLNDNRAAYYGGGIYNGGVFDSSATNSWIVIDGNTDADNVKTNAKNGGGIYNDSNATFTVGGALDVQNNKATGNGGGIYNKGTLTATNVAINYNSATDGGGIYNDSKNLALDGAYIIGNSASRYGGGLENIADLSNSTLTNLYFISNTAGDAGGGIYNMGTLTTSGNVTIDGGNSDDVTVISAMYGGGIYNKGTLTNTGELTVQNNVTTGGGAGVYNSDGTFTNASGASMTVDNNESGSYGGGIRNAYGTFTTLGTLNVTNNTAEKGGAGIFNQGLSSQGKSALFTNVDANGNNGAVTISGNTAQYGGGIMNVNSGSDITLTGSSDKAVTISNNTATGLLTIDEGNDVYGSGAGILNFNNNNIHLKGVTISDNKATGENSRGGGVYNNGTLDATDVTISGNTATDGAGLYNDSKNLTLDGATFKSNEASQAGTSVEGRGGAIYNSGTIQSTGLLTATSNKAFGTHSKGGSIYNAKGASISIERASITDSSGLYGGSIYNAGNITNSGAVTISDTNHEKAQYGGGIYNDDTGVITAKGSLEVTKISSSSSSGGIYNKGIITATGGLTVSYNNAKNNGAGVYNSGTLKNFDEEGNKGSVSILGNKSQQSGGGIYNSGVLTLEGDANVNIVISGNSAIDGAGIYNTSKNLTLNGATFENNAATGNGGGLYNSADLSSQTLKDLTFTSNSAKNGGAIYNAANAKMAVTGETTLTKNTASSYGGGIASYGSFTVAEDASLTIDGGNTDGTEITNANSGGAVYNGVDGEFTVDGALEVKNNKAFASGGGIYNFGKFDVNGAATVSVNTASYGFGGGIYNGEDGTFTVSENASATISGNTTSRYGGGIDNIGTLQLDGATTVSDNTAEAGGGMYNAGTLERSANATLTIQNNQAENGAGLYIDTNGKYNAGDNNNFVLSADDNGKIKFINNGATNGGAIYNAGSLYLDGYAFGVDVSEDEDGNVTLTKNDEINTGVGAAIYNVGKLSNSYGYGEFYAGSAEANDEADNYLSEKKFSLYVANQNGSAIANGVDGEATLSNVKIYANQGGIEVQGGSLTLEKGSEIGADQFTTGNGGTSGYKYYDDGAFSGNTEFGVKVSGGKFTVKQAEATAKYLNQYKDDAQTVRYDDYQVLDVTRISGNGTGLIVSGGEAYLNDVRMEGNENGAVISTGTVKTANTLIDSKVTVSGGEATFTSTTIVNGNESALENNGGTVNLVNSIAVAASGVTNDNSGKGTEEYSAYNFQRDVLGNLYTLGGGSVAANAGVNEDAQYTDGTAIANDLAGHDRVLYGTVDLGAFENPVYWIMGDDSLEDIKTAVESVATIDFGGAVKFDISANGKTFEWEDQANANWIHIYQDVNIDARYLDEDGNYYWMDVTLDGTNTSGTGLFRVVKNGVTANLFSLDVENAASNNRQYPAGALNVLTASAVNLYGVSFENCSGQNGGAIYGGKDAVVNIVSTTADGYVNDKGETELVDDLYKLSVFEGNSGVYGGAVRVNNTSASNTVGGVEYGNGLNITGVDLDDVSYMDGDDWTGTKSVATYDEATGAVKQYSVQFIDNTASEKGGAVYVGGTASIDGASFVNNSVPGTTTSGLYGGGAMFVAGKLDIANADFLDNHSTVSGGAVVVTGQTTGNGNLVFAGNSVDYNPEAVGASADNGGAIYVYDGAKLTLNGVKETEADDATADSATETTGVKTRAIYEGSLSTSGKANEFLGNEAYLGGAVMNRNGSVEISDARFAANLAVDGAGVYNFGTGKVAFNDGVEFESNLAYARAGGVFNAGATSQVTGDATFTNNYASNAGAAWNVEADGDNYAYGSYNPVYDNSNLGDKREATAVSVEGDMSAFGKAAVKSTTLPTLTITAATTTTGLQSTTNVSEWSALNAEIKTDAYAVSKDGSLTQEIVYDATKFTANIDSLQVASGWSVEATETLTDDGMTALQLTFTAEKDQIIENETIGSLSFSTVDRLTEDSELLGVVVERMGYDMNADDSVDLSDLVMFAGKFGTTDSAADFNSDGKVDITDLVKFARHYGVKRETVALASTQAAPQAKTEAVIEAAPKVETEVATVLPETATEATLETVDAKVNATVVPESAPVATTVQDLVFSMDDEDEEDWLEAIYSAQENEKDAIDSLFDF